MVVMWWRRKSLHLHLLTLTLTKKNPDINYFLFYRRESALLLKGVIYPFAWCLKQMNAEMMKTTSSGLSQIRCAGTEIKKCLRCGIHLLPEAPCLSPAALQVKWIHPQVVVATVRHTLSGGARLRQRPRLSAVSSVWRGPLESSHDKHGCNINNKLLIAPPVVSDDIKKEWMVTICKWLPGETFNLPFLSM